jgi:hypothetical protein
MIALVGVDIWLVPPKFQTWKNFIEDEKYLCVINLPKGEHDNINLVC